MQYKAYFGIITGYISYLLGGWDVMLQTLVIFAIFDYITGIISAIYKSEISSKIGYKGILKKVMMFVVVCIASCVDTALQQEILRNVTIMFYIGNEGISILENAVEMDIQVPEKLKKILKLLKDKESGKDDTI